MSRPTLSTVTGIGHILAFCGMIFSAYLFLDSKHAPSVVEWELQKKILEIDIKKDAEARAWYINRRDLDGKLDIADQRRLAFLERQLTEKYGKAELIDKKLMQENSSDAMNPISELIE